MIRLEASKRVVSCLRTRVTLCWDPILTLQSAWLVTTLLGMVGASPPPPSPTSRVVMVGRARYSSSWIGFILRLSILERFRRLMLCKKGAEKERCFLHTHAQCVCMLEPGVNLRCPSLVLSTWLLFVLRWGSHLLVTNHFG